MYRHGDVIIVPVSSIPADATSRPSAVLARGEATGHSHRIADPTDVEVFDHDGNGFLRVGGASATLVHDEHGPIDLPRGSYRFWLQREYSPSEIRRVID
jgi:hypothetical protein